MANAADPRLAWGVGRFRRLVAPVGNVACRLQETRAHYDPEAGAWFVEAQLMYRVDDSAALDPLAHQTFRFALLDPGRVVDARFRSHHIVSPDDFYQRALPDLVFRQLARSGGDPAVGFVFSETDAGRRQRLAPARQP
jgi:hypothetical protein